MLLSPLVSCNHSIISSAESSAPAENSSSALLNGRRVPRVGLGLSGTSTRGRVRFHPWSASLGHLSSGLPMARSGFWAPPRGTLPMTATLAAPTVRLGRAVVAWVVRWWALGAKASARFGGIPHRRSTVSSICCSR
jgi:hypothetical protein